MRFVRLGAIVAAFVVVALSALHAQASLSQPYSTFIVTPDGTASVAHGNTQQFSAVGMGSDEVTWTATGGSISSSGVFVAGSTPGRYAVTAMSGTRMVTVAVNVVEFTATTPRSMMPVAINPGESIQNAVRVNPAGTTFLIKRGVHRRQAVHPKDGMVFVGEPGAVLDGEKTPGPAFDIYQTRNVVIRGLRITNYAPVNTNAAIDAAGSEGSLVEGNEIDHNANSDIMVRTYGVTIGNTSTVRRNVIHDNGWLGINSSKAMDTLIEGNDIYANPPALFNDTVGEAANIKLFDSGRITIRGNYVHDSIFRGIWVDTMRPDVTIEFNRVVNHGRAGIWYEVSYRGMIRNNYVANAGYNQTPIYDWLRGGGIEVSNSPDVSVIDNTVVNSLNGIIGLQAKSYRDGPYGPSQLRNFLVQGNLVVMARGQTGITEDSGNANVFTSWNNRFVSNRFELLNNAAPFAWMGRHLDERQWQAYGQGVNDVFSR